MGRIRSLLIPGVDKRLLVRDAVKVMPDLALGLPVVALLIVLLCSETRPSEESP